MITSFKSDRHSSQYFNVNIITSEKASTSWDSSLYLASGLQEEHHNVTSFLAGRLAATETLGGGEPGRGVMQLPLNYSQAQALEAFGLVTWSIVVKSIGREISGDI